jgi:hypothetical protein
MQALAAIATHLPAALAPNALVKVLVRGSWYVGRCCAVQMGQTGAGCTIAFADGDWRHLSVRDAVAAVAEGNIIPCDAAAADETDKVESFTFTTMSLGRPSRIGGAPSARLGRLAGASPASTSPTTFA